MKPPKNLIVTELKMPNSTDIKHEELERKNLSRKKMLIITGALTLVAAAWFVPIFPEQIPSGFWQEESFKKEQKTIESAIASLRFADNNTYFSRYALSIRTGFTTMRRSILGKRFGRTGTSGANYNYVIPPDLPFLYYDHEARTALLTPDNYENFLEWCKAEASKFSEKQQAEQAGTGQPATRPESKSEGSDKAQPEAERRSR